MEKRKTKKDIVKMLLRNNELDERDEEELINNMLRQYKYEYEIRGGLLIPTENSLEIQQPFVVDLDFDFGEDYITIPVYDNTKEDLEKRRKFNRAKTKQETRQQIDEALYDDFEIDF